MPRFPGQRLFDALHQARAFVGQPGIDLHQRSAGADFFERVLRAAYAACSDNDKPAAGPLAEVADDLGRTLPEGPAAEAAGPDSF